MMSGQDCRSRTSASSAHENAAQPKCMEEARSEEQILCGMSRNLRRTKRESGDNKTEDLRSLGGCI